MEAAPRPEPSSRPTLPEALADELWDEAQPWIRARPLPSRPLLVLLAGPPLSGKTTLARTLEVRAVTATLVVENDELRERVVRRLHGEAPTHDARENFFTYRTAEDLVSRALGAGANVVHDATNLDEGGRRRFYRAADRAGADVVVLVVETAAGVREERALRETDDRAAAHRKLGARRADPGRVGRACLVVDGTGPVSATANALAADPALAPLFLPHPP